jgi:ribosomal protein S6E (S10)
LCRRAFYDKRISQEVEGENIGDEFAGYVSDDDDGDDDDDDDDNTMTTAASRRRGSVDHVHHEDLYARSLSCPGNR